MNGHSKWFLICAALIIAIATLVRVDGIGDGGLDHTELYVPGIDLPEIAHPGPRHTVAQTVRGVVLEAETHPPGYYLMMHPWSAAFGNEPAAMRMPSALLGVGAVLLVMLIAWRVYGSALATCFAGAMMAFSGYQVFWSQHAKMYEPAVFFGLLSMWALLRAQARGARPSDTVAYALATLAALSTLHFAWLLLLAQMVWVTGTCIRQRSEPGLLRAQFLIVALGTPFLIMAAIQAQRSSYVATELSTFVGYLSFGFHISPSHFDPAFYSPDRPWALAAMGGLAIVASVLAMIGAGGPREQRDDPEVRELPRWLRCGAALAGVGATALLIVWIQGNRPQFLSRTLLAGAVPLVAALLLGFGMPRWWPIVRERCKRLAPSWAAGPRGLLLIGAFLPVLLLALASPVTELAAPRTLVMFAPYLLILAAGGLALLLRRSKAWAVVAAILAVSHVASLVHYREAAHHPRDWKELAGLWRPSIQPSDVIFVFPRSATSSGVFVEFSHREYQYVAREWSSFVDSESPGRVWVVQPADARPNTTIYDALARYDEGERIEATGLHVTLFTRP